MLKFIILILLLTACASTNRASQMQRRDPASFAPEHEPATYWLQCHLESKIERVEAPLVRSDEGTSGGPYCKIAKGQCALTEGSRTIEYPSDVTCNVTVKGECPAVEDCVHESIEPARKKQDWERQRTPSRDH